MNEDWSSVFLQALQNSLAQSKAETKWNQELAFRDKQFGLDTQKFEADKEYNNKLLAGQQEDRKINWLNNYTPVTTDFGVIPNYAEGETPLTDPLAIYNKFLASRYGGAIDNPLTPEKDWYIPKTSFTALTADRTAAENKLAQIKTSFTDEKTASDSFNKFVEPVKNMAPLARVNNVGDFFTATDKLWQNAPTGAYYDNTALRALGDKDINWRSTQRDIDAQNYRAMLEHQRGMLQYNLEKERMNPIQTFKVPDGNGGFTYVDGTASEIRAQHGIAVPVNPEEAFTYKVWKDVYNNSSKHGINSSDGYSLEELDKISNLITAKGGDISNAPWLTDALNNEIYKTKRSEYKQNPGKSDLGNFMSSPIGWVPFTPQFWANIADLVIPGDVMGLKQSFGDWEKSGGANTAPYQTAVKLQNKVNRYNTTGAQPRQTLDEYRIRKGLIE